MDIEHRAVDHAWTVRVLGFVADRRDLLAAVGAGRKARGTPARDRAVRPGGLRAAAADHPGAHQDRWPRQGGSLHLRALHADHLPGGRAREAGESGHDHSVHRAGPVWPAMGGDLGEAFREGHAAAGGRGSLRFRRRTLNG